VSDSTISRRRVVVAAVIVAVVVTTAVAIIIGISATQPDRESATSIRAPSDVSVIGDDDPAARAAAASRAFFHRADIAVVASGDDPDALRLATSASERLRSPVLLAGEAGTAELTRLESRDVLAIGVESPGAQSVAAVDADVTAAVDRLARDHPRPTQAASDVLVMAADETGDQAAIATARAAGARHIAVDGDLRADTAAIDEITASPAVVAIGAGLDDGTAYAIEAVRTQAELPGGGYLALPGRHFVALYGHPGTPGLGVLGEEGIQEAIARAKRTAGAYQRLTDEPIVPTFEIIATVASSSAGGDGDYSAETSVDELRPWVEAAGKAGVYVVLDLQPGRTDFLTQAKRYESLLREPHVGLALDPEWRLKKNQKHLTQIGSVGIDEVNGVADWLAALTRENVLPQKVFVLHQFSMAMIRGRERLDTSHPELAPVLHVDGQGSQGAKQGTWRHLREDAPPGTWWGWKNFYHEDEPMLSVGETWRDVDPHPAFISYQ